MQSGRSRLWSRRFPVPRHRLRTSSPRFRTCSPRLPVLAPRSHECRLTLPLCSASPEWPPVAIGRGLDGAGLSAAVHAPMRSSSVVQSPLPVTSAHWGVPSTGNVAGHPTLVGVATTGVSEELTVSEVAPVVPEAVVPTGVLSSLKHTISAVLGPASLAALAAAGLPGIGGLLIISAAGMVVGYRQAKAAATLRAVGIARFARLGPLGVVRSGSLVAVRPRASRVRDLHSGAESLLESVA